MLNVKKLFSFREAPLLLAILGLVIVLKFSSIYFFTPENFGIMSRQVGIALILAVGMTFVILTSDIDLSVGSMVAFASIMVGELGVLHKYPIIPAVILSLLASTILGLVSGLITTKIGLPAFVTTLGMLAVVRGLALGITGGAVISGFNESFTFFGQGSYGPFPIPFLFAVVIAIIAHVVLTQTTFGRQVYFIGSNEEAAKLSGIPTHRIKITTFMICAFLAGVAGILETARLSVGQPSAGVGYELTAIGAAVIGGVSLFGGVGSILGTTLGTVLLILINNGLILLNVDPYWQQVFSGTIIIAAVALNMRKAKS